ncbi:MAG: hypothetical protein ABI315_04435 [Bacteroidia bacterium]
MFISKLDSKSKLIIIIESLGMLIGTSTNLRWIIQNGFLPQNYKAPFKSMLFWDSLIFLDSIALILLILKPKIGLWLTAIIISLDVLHNGIFNLKNSSSNTVYSWMANNWMWIMQFVFGLFVLISFKSILKRIELKLLDLNTLTT